MSPSSLKFSPERTLRNFISTRDERDAPLTDSTDGNNNLTITDPQTDLSSLSSSSSSGSSFSSSAESPTASSSGLPSAITSAHNNTTFNNQTILTGATHASTGTPDGGSGAAGTAVAIFITLALLTVFLVFTYFYMKRRGKLDNIPCFRSMKRKRRSSTSSSRHALDEHEAMEHPDQPKPRGEADDMFTIDDFEDAPEQQEGKEEYYYDEVFGQSHFEDEETNKAMRQLYSGNETQVEEEMLDFDFETLGIKIDDYTLDAARKNTI